MNKNDVINYLKNEIEYCRKEYAKILAKQIAENRFYRTAEENVYDYSASKNRDEEERQQKCLESRIKKCQYDLYVLTHFDINVADLTRRIPCN